MAGSFETSQSQGYATVVGFGPAPGRPSGAGTPAALDPEAEPNWLQDEMKRMEAYTRTQLAKLEEQRRVLLNHQIEVEKELVLKKQQMNQQVCLIGSRVAALHQREQALNEREAALNAESERLRKAQQELLTLFQNQAQAPAEARTAPAALTEPPPTAAAPSARAEVVPLERAPEKRTPPRENPGPAPAEAKNGSSHPGPVPVEPPAPATAPTGTPKKRPDPVALTRVSPGHQAAKASAQKGEARDKPAAALRSGNPVSVSIFPAGEDAEASPGWVIARSATELHLLADEAAEVGALLTVRPTKAAVPFAGVPVKVIDCRRERNQWLLVCRMLQKLSGAFLQLFG